jgi:hypothetical protein
MSAPPCFQTNSIFKQDLLRLAMKTSASTSERHNFTFHPDPALPSLLAVQATSHIAPAFGDADISKYFAEVGKITVVSITEDDYALSISQPHPGYARYDPTKQLVVNNIITLIELKFRVMEITTTKLKVEGKMDSLCVARELVELVCEEMGLNGEIEIARKAVQDHNAIYGGLRGIKKSVFILSSR